MWGAILKYQLQFLNEYGELEIFNPVDWTESSLGAVGEESGAGG